MTTTTKTATHTPGPWQAPSAGIYGPDGVMVATLNVPATHLQRKSLAESAANARLIAAAPDLLACLIEMASGHSMAGEARARAAIVKATGGA